MLCWAVGPHTRRPTSPPGEEVEVSVVLQEAKSGLAQSTSSSSHKCGLREGEAQERNCSSLLLYIMWEPIETRMRALTVGLERVG